MITLSELKGTSVPENVFRVYQENISNLSPENEKFNSLTKTKNKLIRSIVSNQIVKNRRFDIKPPDDACPDCRGLGELYHFQYQKIEEECHSCVKDKNGPTGLFSKLCHTCKGSGRFKRISYGLTINVECTHCTKDENKKPTGQILVKCRSCQGTGIFKKFIMTGKFRNHTICERCQGTGIKSKTGIKPKTTIGTPVINIEMANMLKEVLVESK